MISSISTLAVLVAAGRGERMGTERPKAFLELAGQALLVRALRALETASRVDRVIAVVPPLELQAAQRLIGGSPKLHAIVAGGARRQDSVLEGLKAAPPGFDGVVLVHDAARALAEPQLIDRVAAAAAEHGAALPLLPVVDTLKRVAAGSVVETIERASLGAAQTPQGFRFALLSRAYAAALRDGVTLTDEAMAVERLGERVAVVAGSPRNRKITTAEDLAWAEALLRQEACAPA